MGTLATPVANVANARLVTMERPGSSFPLVAPAPVTLAGRGDKQKRGRTEGIKGSSIICLVGEPTTVAVAVMPPITTTATTMGNTTMDNTTMGITTMAITTMVNTTTANMEMDNTTMATTTMDSAVDSQTEVDVSVTTDSRSEISMETLMEPAKGRTTQAEPGATQRVGPTLAVEICKPQRDSQTIRGLTRPVATMDRIIFLLGSVNEINKLKNIR